MAESTEEENVSNQQDEGVSGKDLMKNIDEEEFSGKIQNSNDGNKLTEDEPLPAEDQDFVSEQEETCAESSGLVKGIIGVLYKG